MVLHDPLDWALEAQVVVDVLRGGAYAVAEKDGDLADFAPPCSRWFFRLLAPPPGIACVTANKDAPKPLYIARTHVGAYWEELGASPTQPYVSISNTWVPCPPRDPPPLAPPF